MEQLIVSEELSLASVRRIFMELISNEGGAVCPLCHQTARAEVKKGINRWMAKGLFILYQAGREEIIHLGSFLAKTEGNRGHDTNLLRHWGLIEAVPRPEGSRQRGSRNQSGFYRVTQMGRDFVEGKLQVPKTIVKRFLQGDYTPEGDLISFQDALRQVLKVNEDQMVVDGTTVD